MHNEMFAAGASKERAVILLHGRGGSAEDMIDFAKQFLRDTLLIAPQADNSVWYPQRFLAPREQNEPHLSAALQAISRAVRATKLPTDKIVIVGFSQGACLASEFAARNPGKYGGIVAFSGGLIGDRAEPPAKSMEGTPMFFGCSQHDPYIPLPRVEESVAAFKTAGASVRTHLYPGNSHTITEVELQAALDIINGI
jgi:phospholipase/carboxylesterase